MISIYYAHSTKTNRDYVQFGFHGYFYEINDQFSKKDDYGRPTEPILSSKNILNYRTTIESEDELTHYSGDKLSIINPENSLILVNREDDKEYLYLKIGYDRFLPIKRDDIEEFLNHPVIEQFDILAVSDFNSILPPGVLNLWKARKTEEIIKIHLFCDEDDGGLIWLDIDDRKSDMYFLEKKELEGFLKKSIVNPMINIIIDNNPIRRVVSDEYIKRYEKTRGKTDPIKYEKISNTLVGFLMNGVYKILQVEALILLELLPKGILVERKK